MIDSRFQFIWQVPEDGFEWGTAYRSAALGANVEPRKGQFLLPHDPDGDARPYKPLEVATGLCMTFARLARTEAAILGFANRYGRLGVETEGVTRSAKGGTTMPGESLATWVREIGRLRAMAELLDDIEGKRHPKLKRVIQWTDNGQRSVRYRTQNRSFVIASDKVRPELMEMFRFNDLVKPAKAVLQHEVNARLAEHTTPAVLWSADGQLGTYFRPKNLLGALWLQFTLTFTTGGTFRQCAHCGTDFEVAPGSARSDKKYCSSSCRVMASRARRKGGQDA